MTKDFIKICIKIFKNFKDWKNIDNKVFANGKKLIRNVKLISYIKPFQLWQNIIRDPSRFENNQFTLSDDEKKL